MKNFFIFSLFFISVISYAATSVKLKHGDFIVVYLKDHCLVVSGAGCPMEIKIPGYFISENDEGLRISTWTPIRDDADFSNTDTYTIVKHKALKVVRAKEIK